MSTTNLSTPTVLDIYSRINAPAFDEKAAIGVSTSFQSLFGGPSGVSINAPSSEDVTVNISRGNEKTAKWRIRGADSELTGSVQADTKGQKFTRLDRVFPLIEERGTITGGELNKTLLQESPYQPFTKQQRATIRAREITNEHFKRIIRKKEIAASEAFRTGQMTVTEPSSGTEVLNFYRNSGLSKVLTNPISDPTTDIQAEYLLGCQKLRTIGRVLGDGIMMGQGSFVSFYNREDIQLLADNRRLSFHSLGMNPGTMPANPVFQRLINGGMQWEGWIKIGPWTLQMFTYIDGYETDADVFTEYLPDDESIIFASRARRDRYYGPSDLLPPDELVNMLFKDLFGIMPGQAIGLMPDGIKNEAIFDAFMFYLSVTKDSDKAYECKTQCAPMFVPMQIDSVYRITGGTV